MTVLNLTLVHGQSDTKCDFLPSGQLLSSLATADYEHLHPYTSSRASLWCQHNPGIKRYAHRKKNQQSPS